MNFCFKPEYKLRLRQAQCMIRLASYQQASEAHGHCEASLSKSKLTDEKKNAVIRDINALRKEADKAEQQGKTEPGSNDITFENKELPGGSSKLKLETSPDKIKGRYVTAVKDRKNFLSLGW